jgi:D-alanine-D-alanine ligase
MKNVAIFFGGISPEHEVSIITGLQVVENIDREKFVPYIIYVTKKGELRYCGNFKDKQDFEISKQNKKCGKYCYLSNRDGKGYLNIKNGFHIKKIEIDIAYTAFHGGNGENGEFQGLLYSIGIPMTSCFSEGSAIAQNKILTKEVLSFYNLPTLPGIGLLSSEILDNSENISKNILTQGLNFPLIVKPAHLGSSIGIHVAHNETELEKSLLESANIDTEVLVEDYIENFEELNCSVRTVNNKIISSVIEKPIAKDEILSFADKYQRGNKSKNSGMASLDREIPADISKELAKQIQSLAVKIYKVCRCKGLVRIDFMVTKDNKIFLTEINSIPGSVAFYIWEASGVSFKQQITESLEQAIRDFDERKSKEIVYETDIVEKFVNS